MSKLYAINDKYVLELINDQRYRVHSNGLVETKISKQGHLTNTFRDARIESNGYYQVSYTSLSDGKRVKVKASRIVWAKFGDKPLDPNLVICHKNDVSLQDEINNLQLDTQSVNNFQSYQNGRAVSYGNAKFTMDQIRKIRAFHKIYRYSYKVMMEVFPEIKSKGQLSEILSQKIWVETNPELQEAAEIAIQEYLCGLVSAKLQENG